VQLDIAVRPDSLNSLSLFLMRAASRFLQTQPNPSSFTRSAHETFLNKPVLNQKSLRLLDALRENLLCCKY
jgi:hypothetical protein